jgi:hypothetical protein
VDGEKVRTLEGPTLAADFIAMVEQHVEARYPRAGSPAAGDGSSGSAALAAAGPRRRA